MLVILTHAEVLHIAITMNERLLRDVPGVTIDARAFRLYFVRAALDDAERAYELSDDELRALDTLLTDTDPRGVKMPDGTSALALVTKLWQARTGSAILPAQNGAEDGRDSYDHKRAYADD